MKKLVIICVKLVWKKFDTMKIFAMFVNKNLKILKLIGIVKMTTLILNKY